MNLDPFRNVTIAPVLFGRTPRVEMRLYVPGRIETRDLPTYTRFAEEIYDGTKCPPGFTRVVTLEINRAGLCFCTVVEPTDELLATVNAWRKANNLRPIRLP